MYCTYCSIVEQNNVGANSQGVLIIIIAYFVNLFYLLSYLSRFSYHYQYQSANNIKNFKLS